MNLFEGIINKIKYRHYVPDDTYGIYENCPRCEANLTLQKGYDHSLLYWTCKSCGQMLTNPSLPGNILWRCDSCEAVLNIQEGFSEECELWQCKECGYNNEIDESSLFLSEEEYQKETKSPYCGLSSKDMLTLTLYNDEGPIDGRNDVMLVRNMEDDRLYVKKILSTYDDSLFDYLITHPIKHMPQVIEVFKSNNNLIVIEEYINGKTLKSILDKRVLSQAEAARTLQRICRIVTDLHSLDKPIIHRDIKPSNIMITDDGDVFLLDMNVAKWYQADEVEDTHLLGTKYYAAPEQLGYGFAASSIKTDIYSMGILLNVMVTGKFPKEKRANEPVWSIVDKCIRLEPQDRLSDKELCNALGDILR